MKFPKLRHAGLCNILIFLPALFLFFAIGFNIPLANWGTPKWVLALNFLLGCAVSLGYLILGAFPLLCTDQVFFPAAGVEALQPGIPHGPGEIRMGEYALYCGLGDRVAVLTYTKQEGKKHLLLEKNPAAYGTSGKSRTRRRWITPEEQKSCRARIESWLVAEGYRFEAETEK